jgi:hypothetical protein
MPIEKTHQQQAANTTTAGTTTTRIETNQVSRKKRLL